MIKIENTIKDKVSQINSSNNVNQYLNIKLEQENNKDSKTTITKSKNQDIYKTIRKKASIINSDQRNIQDKISLIQAQEQKISQIENTLKYAKMFEIENNLNDDISSFSHGMKQKIALIAALSHNPSVLIMDEPFVGLDPKAVFDMKEIMKKMCKEKKTIFFSTHILEVAEKLCDRVAIIKNGKIVKIGKMKDIMGDESLEQVFLELEGK